MFDFSEKDSCGVGFIASRNIPPTHGMTLKVLECLANLDHRGAKFAVFGGLADLTESEVSQKPEHVKALD